MMFLLRILPFIAGVVNGILFFLQVQKPALYPWICVPTILIYLASVILINWRHWKGADQIRSLIPVAVAIIVSGYGLLLTEGVLSRWIIPVFVMLITYAILELQFLQAYVPARYPANSISHLNLFLIPCLYWLAAYTSVGLTVFVNTPRIIPMLVMGGIGLILFYATSHAEAQASLRWRWSWIGMWIGIQLGLLQVVLPLTLAMHGMIAAVCGGYVLRTRRYGIQPPIPVKTILFELIMVLVFLAVALSTARWL